MKTLYTMILKVFIPMFLWTIFFFVLVFELVDVFAKLPQYIGRNTSLLDMTRIALFYVPKCIMYSLPIALLFSVTFTMGNYYMNNELVSIYSSGISLYKLIIPFFAIGIFLSFFMFFFEERAAIPSLAEKNRLYNRALGLGDPNNENNVAVKSVNDKVIYQANYYNDAKKTLTGVIVIERDDEYNLVRRVDADSAEWDEGNSVWVLRNCHIFEWDSRGSMFVERDAPSYTNKDLTDRPRSFQNLTRNIDEMDAGDAYDWVLSLKNAGREYQAAMSEFYKKFSFSLTPLIITLISCSIGGFLKKNVLLMSLFLSICIVVVYYVIQMMAMTFASLGIIPPFFGAWSSFFLFLAGGVVMVRLART